MIEEVLPDLFRIKIPLPNSPLKFLNSYAIRSSRRNLIVDTGLNRKECLKVMLSALRELGLDMGQTDFFITHLHADHFGLVTKLATNTSRIFFNKPDKEILEVSDGWKYILDYAGGHGFPEYELKKALESHPGYRYRSDWIPDMIILKDGDEIEAGRFLFRCVHTPGHTKGHTCLYESEKKILLAGDHVLADITPNIQCWSDQDNPLKSYLSSLDKIYELDLALVLPGHRGFIENHKERIEELKVHHYQRISEILDILDKGPMNAYQIASEMEWDIVCDSWDQFPIAQKWFATGEAIAHIRYLEDEGKIIRKTVEKTITFSRNFGSV